MPGPRALPHGVTLDIHSLIVGCLLMLVGAQSSNFGLIAHRHAVRIGVLPMDEQALRPALTLERMLIFSALLMLIGFVGLGHSVWAWSPAGSAA